MLRKITTTVIPNNSSEVDTYFQIRALPVIHLNHHHHQYQQVLGQKKIYHHTCVCLDNLFHHLLNTIKLFLFSKFSIGDNNIHIAIIINITNVAPPWSNTTKLEWLRCVSDDSTQVPFGLTQKVAIPNSRRESQLRWSAT